jgi:hypothetical protein
VLGVGVYALGGPFIHLGHGRPGAALGSLGIRVVFPFLGALIGGASSKDRQSDDFHPFAVGFLVGVALASATDAIALSSEAAPVVERTPLSTLLVAPVVTRDGAALGLSLRF